MGADPNRIRVSGENSFMRIGESETDLTAEMSHWRVVASPKGVGHVLFAKSVSSNKTPRIYSDNVALARWLQEGVMASMRDTYSGDIPIVDAQFTKSGDGLTTWFEYITSPDEEIVMAWSDFIAPVQVVNPPFENPSQPHGVYSLLIPARRAQLTINGETVPGRAFSRDLFGKEGSSCCLALSETWTIPPDHEWADDAL